MVLRALASGSSNGCTFLFMGQVIVDLGKQDRRRLQTRQVLGLGLNRSVNPLAAESVTQQGAAGRTLKHAHGHVAGDAGVKDDTCLAVDATDFLGRRRRKDIVGSVASGLAAAGAACANWCACVRRRRCRQRLRRTPAADRGDGVCQALLPTAASIPGRARPPGDRFPHNPSARQTPRQKSAPVLPPAAQVHVDQIAGSRQRQPFDTAREVGAGRVNQQVEIELGRQGRQELIHVDAAVVAGTLRRRQADIGAVALRRQRPVRYDRPHGVRTIGSPMRRA